jgi:hypothetical protein
MAARSFRPQPLSAHLLLARPPAALALKLPLLRTLPCLHPCRRLCWPLQWGRVAPHFPPQGLEARLGWQCPAAGPALALHLRRCPEPAHPKPRPQQLSRRLPRLHRRAAWVRLARGVRVWAAASRRHPRTSLEGGGPAGCVLPLAHAGAAQASLVRRGLLPVWEPVDCTPGSGLGPGPWGTAAPALRLHLRPCRCAAKP